MFVFVLNTVKILFSISARGRRGISGSSPVICSILTP